MFQSFQPTLAWQSEYIDHGQHRLGTPIAHFYAVGSKLYRIVHYIGFGQKWQATVNGPDGSEAFEEFAKIEDAKAWCEAHEARVAAVSGRAA